MHESHPELDVDCTPEIELALLFEDCPRTYHDDYRYTSGSHSMDDCLMPAMVRSATPPHGCPVTDSSRDYLTIPAIPNYRYTHQCCRKLQRCPYGLHMPTISLLSEFRRHRS